MFELEGATTTWPFSVKLYDETIEQIDGAVHYEDLHCLDKPVKFGDSFALMSEVEHDIMIYGKRPVGINLVWMKDFYKSTWDRIKGGRVGDQRARR